MNTTTRPIKPRLVAVPDSTPMQKLCSALLKHAQQLADLDQRLAKLEGRGHVRH